MAPTADKPKEPEQPAAPTKDGKTDKPAAPTGDKPKEPEQPAAPVKDGKGDKPVAPTADKPKEPEQPAAPTKDGKTDKPAAPTGDKPKEPEQPAAPAKGGQTDKPVAPTSDKPKETEKPVAPVKGAPAPAAMTGPAAAGPAGTAITQIFDQRLDPPDEKAMKALPVPQEGESFFITLHPAYLEKSKFNTFSVDTSSDNYKELLKSVELVGIKDPVLTRINPDGGLEILSGQRRHLAAKELNYSVPAIIQKIDDADAKIIVADGNLHRDKISTYDLSRALRIKMEGMKQKAGRRKKGFTAEELNSDEKLAKEMGMSVSKLNRIIRLSEASKDVCDRVDDGSLALSIASAISFLKPKNQDEVLHLADLGYKVTNERVERMKKAEKSGKFDEMTMRDILDDKDIAPKQVVPPAPAPSTPAAPPAAMPTAPANEPTVPASPVEKPTTATNNAQQTPSPTAVPPAPEAHAPDKEKGKETDVFKGGQERPENAKVILTGDRLRKYFPDVSMTPREMEESIYDALEERRQRQIKQQQKDAIFKKSGPTH